MSRSALRVYVAGLLEGIPGEGPDDPDVVVFPNPPKIDDFGDCVIITKITSREERMAVPRGGGRKKITSKVTVVVGAERTESEAVVDRMDYLVQQVIYKLRTATPLPAGITDGTEQSAVIMIGEDIEVLDDRLETLGEYEGAEGMVSNLVALSLDVQEIIVA